MTEGGGNAVKWKHMMGTKYLMGTKHRDLEIRCKIYFEGEKWKCLIIKQGNFYYKIVKKYFVFEKSYLNYGGSDMIGFIGAEDISILRVLSFRWCFSFKR